jgi:hypothetical protein
MSTMHTTTVVVLYCMASPLASLVGTVQVQYLYRKVPVQYCTTRV